LEGRFVDRFLVLRIDRMINAGECRR